MNVLITMIEVSIFIAMENLFEREKYIYTIYIYKYKDGDMQN